MSGSPADCILPPPKQKTKLKTTLHYIYDKLNWSLPGREAFTVNDAAALWQDGVAGSDHE